MKAYDSATQDEQAESSSPRGGVLAKRWKQQKLDGSKVVSGQGANWWVQQLLEFGKEGRATGQWLKPDDA